MRTPTKDCDCEDFPCCEHADNFPEDELAWCDMCGVHHQGDCWEEPELDEWEDDEEEAIHTHGTYYQADCPVCTADPPPGIEVETPMADILLDY